MKIWIDRRELILIKLVSCVHPVIYFNWSFGNINQNIVPVQKVQKTPHYIQRWTEVKETLDTAMNRYNYKTLNTAMNRYNYKTLNTAMNRYKSKTLNTAINRSLRHWIQQWTDISLRHQLQQWTDISLRHQLQQWTDISLRHWIQQWTEVKDTEYSNERYKYHIFCFVSVLFLFCF